MRYTLLYRMKACTWIFSRWRNATYPLSGLQRTLRFVFLWAILTLPFAPYIQAAVVINEFMSSNGETIMDEEDDYEDWIELYNTGTTTVDLTGWGLSDNDSHPFKWQFPAGATIGPGEHLLVWASGKDRDAGQELPGIVRDLWGGIPGATIGSLTNHFSYSFDPSSRKLFTEHFETWHNWRSNYGQRLRGMIVAPATGKYRFWIASNNQSQMRISTDENPANAAIIAYVDGWTNWREWNKYASQQSEEIHLEKGQRYYVEVLMKQGDGDDNLTVRWQLPDGTIEEPMSAEHVVQPKLTEYHTNFRISSGGEPLSLTRPDGTTEDHVPATYVPRDVSYGRLTDGADTWHYFADPTPGATNDSTPKALPPMVIISEPRGFRENPFKVTLSATEPGATIRYTLDGSHPTSESTIYEEPITVDKTTMLRAAVVGPDLLPLPPATTTWLFMDDILQQDSTPPPGWPANRAVNNKLMVYGMQPAIVDSDNERLRQGMKDIPSMSLVTDLDNLFAPQYGIYSHSDQSFGWNRVGSLELIDPQGDPDKEFQIDITFRLRGAWSRMVNNPKNSFRFFFRSQHGDRDLEFPLFDDEGPSSFKKVDLRTAQNYSWALQRDHRNTFMRDVFSRDTQRDMGMPYTRSRFYHLYINGQYWGLYQTQERGDDDYGATHFGGNSDEWDTIKTGTPGYVTTASDGNTDAWRALRDMTVYEGFAGDYADNYWRVQGQNPDGSPNPDYPKYIDQDNLIEYMLISHYTGDNDGPVGRGGTPNNINAIFNRENPTGFIWFRHDAEHSLGARDGINLNTTALGTADMHREDQRFFNPALVHWRMAKHPEYRMRIADRVQKHVFGDGALTPENAQARVESRMAEIDYPIIAESARWRQNTSHTRQTWLNACNAVLSYLDQRRDIFVQQYRNRGWFPSIDAPQAYFHNGYLRVYADTPFYYLLDDGDPRLVGGDIAPNAIPVTSAQSTDAYTATGNGTYSVDIPLHANQTLRARAWHASEWSALTEVQLSDGIPEGTLIHAWDFESPIDFLDPSYTLGGGALAILDGPETEVRRNDAAQGFPSAHLRVNNPLGAEVTFQVPTTGFEHIQLTYDTRRSGQGAGIQTLHVTTNGTAWEAIDSYAVYNEDPQPQHYSFSNLPGSSNNPDFAVRFTFMQGDGSTAGNNRFDDVKLSGVALPGVNLPPTAENPPDMQRLIEQGDQQIIPLDAIFEDPDDDPLSFSVSSDNTAVTAAAIIDDNLLLIPGTRGQAGITLTADDGHNTPVDTQFHVLVYPAAHRLADNPYLFGKWSPDEPAGAYPENMIFLQGDRNDAGINTPLDYAYHIPAYDAAAEEDIAFPYAADTRTRINGLQAMGIAFINTGRGRDLGGALLAIDTTDTSDSIVSWTGGTILPNERIYAIRLQYRIGTEGPFQDLKTADDLPSEYLRHPTQENHIQAMEPIALPDEAMNQPYVQLLWRYYRVTGDAGPRAQLRLDDILLLGDHAAESVFLPTGDGEWHVADNWSTPYFPSGSGLRARIGAPDDQDRDVDLTGSATLGRLTMQNATTPHRNRVRGDEDHHTLTWSRSGEPAELMIEGEGEGFTEFRIDGGTILQAPLVLTVPHQENPGEYGALRLRRGWSGPGGIIKRGPGRATLTGSDKDFTGPITIEQGVLAITQPATPAQSSGITVEPGGQLRLISAYGPETPAIYSFTGILELASLGRTGVAEDENLGVLGAIRYEPGSPDNHAILDGPIMITGPASLHVAHAENKMTIVSSVNGEAPLSKSGGGVLILDAAASYSGAITIETGTLRVQEDWQNADIEVTTDTYLEGSGRVGNISGNGTIRPGPQSTILTGKTLEAGSRVHFTLGRTGSPEYSSPTDSINALLRLTDAEPIQNLLHTTLAFFLAEGEPTADSVFRGGIFTDNNAALQNAIDQADIKLYVPDPEGPVEHNDTTYRLYDGPLTPVVDTVSTRAPFPGETVEGRVMRIWFTEGGDPVEPVLALETYTATFRYSPGGMQPEPQRIAITNAGNGTLSAIQFSILDNDTGWLRAHRGGHGNPQTITLTPRAETLPPGLYTATLTIRCENATNTEERILVTLQVTEEINRATLPYQQHWESFTPGSSMVGHEGWHAADAAHATVMVDAYTYHYTRPPLDPSPPSHDQVLRLANHTVSNLYHTAGYTNVIIDTMAQFTHATSRKDFEHVIDNPEVQMAVVANTNGNLVVLHQDALTHTNRVTELSDNTVPAIHNDWARITIELDYRSCPANHRFFRVALHDQPWLTHQQGFTIPNIAEGERGGAWLLSANQDHHTTYLRSIIFRGIEAIDDIRVVPEGWFDPSRAIIDTVGNAISDDWELAHFGYIGIDPHADADGSGMTNWEEFLAGTDPHDSNSVLRIESIKQTAQNQIAIRWNSRQTDTVPMRYYRILKADDPHSTSPIDWNAIAKDLAPDGDETLYEDTSETSDTTHWYRIEVQP